MIPKILRRLCPGTEVESSKWQLSLLIVVSCVAKGYLTGGPTPYMDTETFDQAWLALLGLLGVQGGVDIAKIMKGKQE